MRLHYKPVSVSPDETCVSTKGNHEQSANSATNEARAETNLIVDSMLAVSTSVCVSTLLLKD